MGQVYLEPSYWNADTTLKTGWGAQAWSDGEWGELKDQTISPYLVYQLHLLLDL